MLNERNRKIWVENQKRCSNDDLTINLPIKQRTNYATKELRTLQRRRKPRVMCQVVTSYTFDSSIRKEPPSVLRDSARSAWTFLVLKRVHVHSIIRGHGKASVLVSKGNARPLPPLEFFHERRLKFFLDSVLEFEKFTNRKQNEFQAICFIFHVLEFQATSSYIKFFFHYILSSVLKPNLCSRIFVGFDLLAMSCFENTFLEGN